MHSQVYHLDPDFRKEPDTSKPYCCRCQKVIKDPGKAVEVTVNWENWRVAIGHNRRNEELTGLTANKVTENALMGADCWRQITKAGAA